MTQVDFYILNENSQRNIEILTCQLIEKAVAQQHSVYIQCTSSEQANRLDELLWKYKPESFLAHKNLLQSDLQKNKDIEAYHYPVVIGSGEDIINGYDQLLINLDAQVPQFFSRFHRVAEMVSNDNSDKELARQRYRFYKERGYPLKNHDIQ